MSTFATRSPSPDGPGPGTRGTACGADGGRPTLIGRAFVNQPHEGKRLFSYAEAVALLPLVRQVTDEAHGRVERLLATAADSTHTREQAQSIVNAWAAEMGQLGLDIKGLWLVDFDNGSGYYCWKHPETSLDYYHTYEEGFGGRVRIQ